jgi:hypothetical protein
MPLPQVIEEPGVSLAPVWYDQLSLEHKLSVFLHLMTPKDWAQEMDMPLLSSKTGTILDMDHCRYRQPWRRAQWNATLGLLTDFQALFIYSSSILLVYFDEFVTCLEFEMQIAIFETDDCSETAHLIGCRG